MRAGALCVLLLTTSLAGCQSLQGYPTPLETPQQALATVKADILPDAITAYAALTDPGQRAARRDQIVRARIYAIDINYDQFTREVTAQQKSFAIGADLVSAGLTGAATLAKSAATKTRLTTYASAALGVRATVDKELFYSKTLPAVITQMDATRKTVLAKIIEGLAQPDASYPLIAALADLQDYYVSGTLNGALNQISKDAGVKNDAAERRITSVKSVKYATDSAHNSLSDYLFNGGTQPDPGREQTMLSCVPTTGGAAATPVGLEGIMNDGTPEAASQRTALAACLKSRDPSFN